MKRDTIDKPWGKSTPEPCPHAVIVPIDADWGRCIACGDGTFPMSNSAAWGCDDSGPHDADKRQHNSAVAAYIRDLEEQRDGAVTMIESWVLRCCLGKSAREIADGIRNREWASPSLGESGSGDVAGE